MPNPHRSNAIDRSSRVLTKLELEFVEEEALRVARESNFSILGIDDQRLFISKIVAVLSEVFKKFISSTKRDGVASFEPIIAFEASPHGAYGLEHTLVFPIIFAVSIELNDSQQDYCVSFKAMTYFVSKILLSVPVIDFSSEDIVYELKRTLLENLAKLMPGKKEIFIFLACGDKKSSLHTSVRTVVEEFYDYLIKQGRDPFSIRFGAKVSPDGNKVSFTSVVVGTSLDVPKQMLQTDKRHTVTGDLIIHFEDKFAKLKV